MPAATMCRTGKRNEAAHDAAAPLELERFLPYRLSVLANTVSDAIARLYRARFGLTVPEWRAIAVLARFAPLTAGGVCEKTRMDKVTVSRALTRLVAAGLVRRATDPGDARKARLALSRTGKTLHARIAPLARQREAELLDGLSGEDREFLDRLLGILQARADSLAGDVPDRPTA